jgi:hypothetical protein
LIAPRPAPWWNSLQNFLRPRGVQLVFGTSLAGLALLAAAIWLVIENHGLSYHVEQMRSQQESLVNQTRANENEARIMEWELKDEIAALRAQHSEMQTKVDQKKSELQALRNAQRLYRPGPSEGVLAMFVLSPGLTRGTDEPEKLIISAAVRSIQLQLDLEKEENYQGYLAEIRTARGNLIWSRSSLKIQRTTYGQAVLLTIPAKLFSPGEYEIALEGTAEGKREAVGYYYIIALKK